MPSSRPASLEALSKSLTGIAGLDAILEGGYLPDLIVCRPELSEQILKYVADHGVE